jgi:hypothetical protein
MLGKTLEPEIERSVAARNHSVPTPSRLDEAARKSSEESFRDACTSPAGLSEAEAITRLEEHGTNEVAYERKEGCTGFTLRPAIR